MWIFYFNICFKTKKVTVTIALVNIDIYLLSNDVWHDHDLLNLLFKSSSNQRYVCLAQVSNTIFKSIIIAEKR